MSGEVATERRAGILHATCLVCGKTTSQPDKGIGRANLAAWRTQHQHAAPCGVTFRHDWHGFLDDDGRTCVCDGHPRVPSTSEGEGA